MYVPRDARSGWKPTFGVLMQGARPVRRARRGCTAATSVSWPTRRSVAGRRCKTVRRYLRAATADDLLTETVPRPRDLDEHTAYLASRGEQGCTNAVRLTTELRERGYRGSARTVRRLLQAWRDGTIKPTAVAPVAPKPREVTGWIIRPAGERTDREQADMVRILERCDSLRTVDRLVSELSKATFVD